MSILLDIKLLLLLWLINFTPPLLAFFLEDSLNKPIDLGRTFKDKKPLLGPHKTWRGLAGALLCGSFLAMLLGLPFWLGLATAILSMTGDMVSSFIKRRLNKPSGRNFPVLDQFFEGALPFLVISPYLGIGYIRSFILIILFCLGAYIGSVFYKSILLKEPFPWYPRKLKARTRLKEISSCSSGFKHIQPVFHFEEAIYYHWLIKRFFKVAGLYERGIKNALDVQVVRKVVTMPNLPEEFDNFNIVYFSDLHIDGLTELVPRVSQLLEQEDPDICVFGGDLRMSTYGNYQTCLELFSEIAARIRSRYGNYAVLGNHDCLEMIPVMENLGFRVLLNDSARIDKNGQSIYLAGVDDPHYYNCANVEMAARNIPDEAFKIFLCHSPEMYKQAASVGMDLYLCGHTHAGQVQLPRIGPVFTHSRSPRSMAQGFWVNGSMQGYTSAGAGVSGVPVRFLTRGEILSLTLIR
ncbi:CDP-archaeol synthase [Desulfonatronovibrio hydrogenovorans]|uniref:CDP-archaeol synthase n=1 Tax=Desulfonatronovibrio hydrogenovorans TaxID=53245 RepID=UPI00055617EE|nr:CDP-archaeol synthase [Desulfonatronovibrio hydrogenovorans]